MLFKRMQVVAQVIGFICIGLLAVYGGVAWVSGGPSVWAADSAAQEAITPALLSYQGTLRDTADQPASGTYDMEVSIYDNAEGTGAALWSENHTGVDVREGDFNLLLGETSALSQDIFTESDRYIELKVGLAGMTKTVMTPRQRFAAVPYAIAATYATQLSAPDGDPGGALKVNNAGDVVIGQHGMCIDSDGYCEAPRAGALGVGGGGIHGLNTSGQDLYLVPDTGNVGIGTKNPQSKLDVNGGASVAGTLGVGTTSPDTTMSVIGDVRAANDANETDYTEIGHGGANGFINMVGEGALKFRHEGNNRMSLSDTGDLNVSGNVNADSLTVDGRKPIFFKKFTCTGDGYCNVWDDNLHVDTWACGIVGVSVAADQDENAGLVDPLFRAIALPNDTDGDGRDEWRFSLDVHDVIGKDQTWVFVAMCAKRDIADLIDF